MKRLVDTKSEPARSKLISPGSNSLLPLRSCQQEARHEMDVLVRHLQFVGVPVVREPSAAALDRPCWPLPVMSYAAWRRGTIEFHVLKLIRSQHLAG